MVHIKKVEIFGFKSFGFKNTVVEFEPGLVSISGPNGSGKSNILDAIIFALGENKPSVMRAPSLRKLIHDIESETRRGPKMARTAVQFDNTDRKIPVDSDLVTITREMSDKGENIYTLNKTKVQRQKILELMDLSNAGLNQINAVQQGTVTRISEMTPEEKRIVIEDLIGLSAFDEKKKEAEKQLVDADHKLDIALAKMGEVKKRIDELEEERNTKLRSDMIERELNKYHAISAAGKLKTILNEKLSKERTVNSLNSEKKKFDEEKTELKKQYDQIKNERDQFRDELNDYNKRKASLDSELSTVKRDFDEVSSAISTKGKRWKVINSRLPEITNTLQELNEEHTTSDTQIAELKEAVRVGKEKKKHIDEQMHSIDSQRTDVLRKQSQLATEKTTTDKKIKGIDNKLSHVKLTIAKFETELSDINEKINSNTEKQNKISGGLILLEKQKQKLENAIRNHNESIKELKIRIGKYGTQKIKIETECEELLGLIDASSTGANKYQTKIKFVKGIMHEDYSISKLKHDSEKLGIDGLVYEILKWDKQYERAILAVSSDWIKSVVVKDFTTMISLAETVKERKLPKLKIIPLDAIPNFTLELPNDPGVLGILSNYVSCDQRFSSLKTFLFGNVILTDSRESAHRISKLGYKTITKDGEYFEAKATAFILDINSKISKLTKIINMTDSVDGLFQMIKMLKVNYQKKKLYLKKIELNKKKYDERLSLSESGLIITKNSLLDLRQKLHTASKNEQHHKTRINQLSRKKERYERELIQQKSHLDSLKTQFGLVHENYAEPQNTRIANELTFLNDRKSKLHMEQNEVISLLGENQTSLASLLASETKYKSESKDLHHEQVELKQEKHRLEVDIRQDVKDKQKQNDVLVEFRAREQELISTSGTSVDRMKSYDSDIDELTTKINRLTKDHNDRERSTDRIDRDLDDLRQRESGIRSLLDKFGFDENIEIFDVDSAVSSLEKEQTRLNTSLNAGSPAQYVEVSNGYRSSSSKKNLLQNERNSIVAFIESVEKEKRQTFLNAFDTVDKEIRDIFTKMTGGNAWLELENEDDIFTTGLNYIIQFQNKPKRESTSISGGEKSLAAIVFVLALQRLNPSPFYLFDEVDAALDAPNAEKLSNIIKQRSEGSQFLMVSLKDSVVEKAKLIYGVFPKNGVSNVVKYKDKTMPEIAT